MVLARRFMNHVCGCRFDNPLSIIPTLVHSTHNLLKIKLQHLTVTFHNQLLIVERNTISPCLCYGPGAEVGIL